jgi:hypothetical protein
MKVSSHGCVDYQRDTDALGLVPYAAERNRGDARRAALLTKERSELEEA